VNAAVLLALGLLMVPSRYLSVEVDIDWEPGRRVTTVAYTAVAGDDGRFMRVSRDFDPDYMEVELIRGEYGFPGSTREVPGWAVDSLTGSPGWPRALVAAFPGLRPGMTMNWTFRVTDTGPFSSQGLFYTYIAGEEPDTIIVRCREYDGLSWHAAGFTQREDGDQVVFISAGEDFRELWLSTASDWAEVDSILMNSSREASAVVPPDLREASIEAGAAGALPRMRISRGRVLITESMQLQGFPGGDAGFQVRSIQEILDTRRATPIEAATLLTAMCRVMGMEASVVPSTDIHPPIPTPLGFHRAFVLVDGLLEEPSEYLSPVGWVDTEDTLWLLLPGGTLAELPPETSQEICREDWTVSPDEGRFSLLVTASGGYDRELRRRLAGLDDEEMLLRVAEWLRASGVHFFPDTLIVSDFYDLTETASMEVSGFIARFPGPWAERTPSLLWNRDGVVNRTCNGSVPAGRLIIR